MVAKATCPRCDTTNTLPACGNCGAGPFRKGVLSNLQTGLYCDKCGLGFSYVPCSQCGSMIPATSYSDPAAALGAIGGLILSIFFLWCFLKLFCLGRLF